MSVSEERLLSLEDVAERLQVSDQSVRRWIKAGKLAAYKPGLEWRIRTSDLEDFLETHSSPKVQAPLSSADQRRAPTPAELNAIETLKGHRDHLEEFLERAKRKDIAPVFWVIEADHTIDMAAVGLALLEREYLRSLLLPTAAQLVQLADEVFDGLRDAEAEEEVKRRREAIRPLEEAVA
jgi:excisionase family DNA binding protein